MPTETFVNVDGARTRLLTGDFPGRDEQVRERMRWAAEPGHYASMVAPHTPVPDALRRERPVSSYPAGLKGTGVPTLLIAGERDDR
jgi:hypothetical protein